MNIKRSLALVLFILVAAPLAATQYGPSVQLVPTQDSSKSFEHSWGFYNDHGDFLEGKMISSGQSNGTFAGIVQVGADRWYVRQTPDGQQTAQWVDPSQVPGDTVIYTDKASAQSVDIPRELSAPAGHVTNDAVIVYEPEAADAAGGEDALKALIGIGVQDANDMVANSGATWLSLNNVGMVNLGYNIAATSSQVWDPSFEDKILQIREQYHADVVFFIAKDWDTGGVADEYCGGNSRCAFAVVRWDAISFGTLGHEWGHILGLLHNLEDDSNDYGLPHYAHSMSVCYKMGDPDNFSGRMSKSPADGCGIAQLLNYISGDGVYINGAQFWTDYSRQVQVLEQTAAVVAEYRTAPAPCVSGGGVACIDSETGTGDKRFSVNISFSSPSRSIGGVAQTTWTSSQGALFWFFDPSNPEVLVKVLNGCAINGHYWVYFTAGTNLGYVATITDTTTGQEFQYSNVDGVAALPVQDTSAIPCN